MYFYILRKNWIAQVSIVERLLTLLLVIGFLWVLWLASATHFWTELHCLHMRSYSVVLLCFCPKNCWPVIQDPWTSQNIHTPNIVWNPALCGWCDSSDVHVAYLLKWVLKYATSQKKFRICPVACAGVIAISHTCCADVTLILSAYTTVIYAESCCFCIFFLYVFWLILCFNWGCRARTPELPL